MVSSCRVGETISDQSSVSDSKVTSLSAMASRPPGGGGRGRGRGSLPVPDEPIKRKRGLFNKDRACPRLDAIGGGVKQFQCRGGVLGCTSRHTRVVVHLCPLISLNPRLEGAREPSHYSHVCMHAPMQHTCYSRAVAVTTTTSTRVSDSGMAVAVQ